MVSSLCSNWWRIGGQGRITVSPCPAQSLSPLDPDPQFLLVVFALQVPNSRNAGTSLPQTASASPSIADPLRSPPTVEQWRATRSTNWSDWFAVGRTSGAGEKGQVVDVKAKVQRKRATHAAGVIALLGTAWYLTDPRVAHLVERLRA